MHKYVYKKLSEEQATATQLAYVCFNQLLPGRPE